MTVVAHSMGNVVAGEALRGYEGKRLKAYVACQAAMSAQFYDNTVARAHPCRVFVRWVYFPQTPDIMGHFATGDGRSGPYMAGNTGKVERMCNYYNPQDFALRQWERNNVLKPDDRLGYDFGYRGRRDMYEEPRDYFYRNEIGFRIWRLSVQDTRERYLIFAYGAESRSCALGQAHNGAFGEYNWDLSVSRKDDDMGYNKKRYSHSREFRSNIVDERKFWRRLCKDAGLEFRDEEGEQRI